ncbi:DUF4185 domain-containing protein [Tomitella fengzijianii]|uniref:DUF4185 domain-containing protein n=1 Tax=Tomitella fengzijianii TaxID=2597660 RepID=A0A516X6R3_9ACTN|nr:DUF4185 domain-containing protein [Tomitella fengzijianii]QDQ98703.1 DUF4185 domain-containing protein [Tomitella fengzijianii]
MTPPPGRARYVATLTGRLRTDRWGVAGTDLGIPAQLSSGAVAYFFGDTFESSAAGGPGWRSPVMLRSAAGALDGGALEDGIVFDGACGGRYAREILPNAHEPSERPDPETPGSEFTVIPCDAITVDRRVYLSVVSVHSWNSAAAPTNFTYLARSDDLGVTWQRTDARWDNTGGALDQMWTMDRADGYVYIMSSAFDRANPGGVILRRVPEHRIEEPWAYEAWVPERDEMPSGVWMSVRSAPVVPVLPGPVGELSLRRIDGTWVLAGFDPAAYAITTRTAPDPTGPWSEPVVQVAGGEWGAGDGTFAQIYGGFIHPDSTLDDLHLLVSQWNTAEGAPYHVLQFRTSVAA